MFFYPKINSWSFSQEHIKLLFSWVDFHPIVCNDDDDYYDLKPRKGCNWYTITSLQRFLQLFYFNMMNFILPREGTSWCCSKILLENSENKNCITLKYKKPLDGWLPNTPANWFLKRTLNCNQNLFSTFEDD